MWRFWSSLTFVRSTVRTRKIPWVDGEKKLLSILDEIGVKRQAYHGNVFIGNHCQVILAKDKNQVFNFVKLCNVLTDKVTKDHFVELFRIYREAHS